MSSERRRPSPAEIVHHARRRIALIRDWTRADTEVTYLANEERQAAVERNFIAIGEAIKGIARSVQDDLQLLDAALERLAPLVGDTTIGG